MGVEIGIGGQVEQSERISAYQPDWGWQSVPLATLLQEHLYMPIYSDNVTKALASTFSLSFVWSSHAILSSNRSRP